MKFSLLPYQRVVLLSPRAPDEVRRRLEAATAPHPILSVLRSDPGKPLRGSVTRAPFKVTRARGGFFGDQQAGTAIAAGEVRPAADGTRVEVVLRLAGEMAFFFLAVSVPAASFLVLSERWGGWLTPALLPLFIAYMYARMLRGFRGEASRLRAVLEQVLDARVEEGSARTTAPRPRNPLVRG